MLGKHVINKSPESVRTPTAGNGESRRHKVIGFKNSSSANIPIDYLRVMMNAIPRHGDISVTETGDGSKRPMHQLTLPSELDWR
jgi:hypothetical protein